MEERSTLNSTEEKEQPVPPKKGVAALSFLTDIARGAAIGVAFIIPGFSGGSVAAILGIYEKLVGAIADIFKTFKKSFFTLLPIAIGMLLGVAALIFPIQWGLRHYPIPTVTLFVGLALGGLPSIAEKVKGKPSPWQIVAGVLALGVAAALSFLPLAGEVDLFALEWWGYLLLIVIGIVGSCALVVPGISGSMLLLIFGYYNPIVDMLLNHLLRGDQIGICLAVFACLGVGIVVGFFAISLLMKFLLKKFPKATHFAIIGFIVGSVPAVYASTIRESNEALSVLYSSPLYWIAAVCLFAIGLGLSLLLVVYAKKSKKQNTEGEK